MIGHELRIEELESAGLETRDEVHERDLGSVARAVEHALAEERATERDAVKTADEGFAVVDFEAVAMTPVVQLAIEHADARVDPRARAAGAGLGAALKHRVEVAVDGDGEAVRAHGAGEAGRQVKAIERDNAALLGLEPIERRILGALRHGEDAAGIGLEQDLRRDLDERGLAVGHAFTSGGADAS